jgi:tetratricopeptide (TPR) repeat protein
LAIGTKENAVMLPISILLYDIFFIQGISKENIKKNVKMLIIPAIIIIAGIMIFYDFSSITKDYSIRPFTMKERLLTEPRVILFYISLLFYPLTSRLTLIHDIEISRGLFAPWTTLAAILAIVLIIIICVIKAKKWPLITYCILFFFINHFIEGSFFSLELIFEHRNYLPSMLLFIPFSILLVKGLEFFYQKKITFYLLSAIITGLIIVLSITVYLQNDIMKDEFSLWSDNVEKSPRLHSPRQSLGLAFLNVGCYSEALKELELALNSFESGAFPKKALTYACLGECYYFTGKDDKAKLFYVKSLNVYPPWSHKPVIFDRLASILMRENLLDNAEQMVLKAISLDPRESRYLLTYSAILIKKKQPDEAIKKAQEALRLNVNSLNAYRYIADAYALKKNKATENHFRMLSKGTNR